MTMTAEDQAAVSEATATAGPSVAARSRSFLAPLFGTYGQLLAIGILALVLLVWAPSALSDFRLGTLGKYCCWAMAAVGIGLAWGRGGMLVLGQGVFFGLGGYVMAMHMKLEAAGPGNVPDFMTLYGDGTMPGWWEPFRSGTFTLIMIVALPAIVSFILGFAILKRGVKGAYFAILTQAMAVAFSTLLIATIKQTGGFNGLNTFSTFFGHNLYDPDVKKNLYLIAAGLLIACMLVVWQLYRSRYGELLLATRDAEERVRFLGYDPANVKLVAFVVAAVMASIGGAMFAPLVGIISPSDVNASASIMLIAGVALGGRGSLLGPVLGTIAVGYGQSTLSSQFPTTWVYFQGALFILVILFLPGGLASLGSKLRRLRPNRASGAAPAARSATADAEAIA